MPPPRPPLNRTLWRSPVGDLILVASPAHLWGVWFADQKGIPEWGMNAPELALVDHSVLRATVGQLNEYFTGKRHTFDLPLEFSWGSAFQQAVWHALAQIGYGQTVSYRDVSLAIGRPSAIRAVGGAVGRNPLGVVLPCHRVLGSQGQLTGYTGGLDRKAALLALEAEHGPTKEAA
ncbi:MAG: hypothetical protein RL323_335 [Pseudomonadota bacterium]